MKRAQKVTSNPILFNCMKYHSTVTLSLDLSDFAVNCYVFKFARTYGARSLCLGMWALPLQTKQHLPSTTVLCDGLSSRFERIHTVKSCRPPSCGTWICSEQPSGETSTETSVRERAYGRLQTAHCISWPVGRAMRKTVLSANRIHLSSDKDFSHIYSA